MSKRAVYVISTGTQGLTKIGISRKPADRLQGLQTASAAKLRLAYVHTPEHHSALAIERTAHALLAAKRQQGEWFDVTPEQAIEAIHEAVAALDATPIVPIWDTRATALQMLESGKASPAEIADLAGVSRQLVRYWAERAGIDWQKARDKHLASEWRKAKG